MQIDDKEWKTTVDFGHVPALGPPLTVSVFKLMSGSEIRFRFDLHCKRMSGLQSCLLWMVNYTCKIPCRGIIVTLLCFIQSVQLFMSHTLTL